MPKKVSSLKKALDLLEQAAQEQKDDLKSLLSDEYQNFSETLSDLKPKLEETAQKVSDTAENLKKDVEEAIKKDPMLALGIAAGVGFLLASILRRK